MLRTPCDIDEPVQGASPSWDTAAQFGRDSEGCERNEAGKEIFKISIYLEIDLKDLWHPASWRQFTLQIVSDVLQGGKREKCGETTSDLSFLGPILRRNLCFHAARPAFSLPSNFLSFIQILGRVRRTVGGC